MESSTTRFHNVMITPTRYYFDPRLPRIKASNGQFVSYEDFSKLMDALSEYGGHTSDCTVRRFTISATGCDCGWREIEKTL